jgi:hypothetical protein
MRTMLRNSGVEVVLVAFGVIGQATRSSRAGGRQVIGRTPLTSHRTGPGRWCRTQGGGGGLVSCAGVGEREPRHDRATPLFVDGNAARLRLRGAVPSAWLDAVLPFPGA